MVSKYNLGVPLLRMERAVYDFGQFFMERVDFEYKLFIKLKKQPPTLICNITNESPSCQTESKAFLKSTKQA